MARNMNKSTAAQAAEHVVTESPVEVVEKVATKPVEKRKFGETEPIDCMAITAGELGMIGIKSGINYRWAGRGDITQVEYQDLVAAVRSSKKHVYHPYFIIQDDDFIAQFPQVARVYDNMYSLDDLKDVFKLTPAQMKSAIMSLPAGAQESVKHIASNMISTGKLDSVQKIKVLDEIYDTKFMLMTELFG